MDQDGGSPRDPQTGDDMVHAAFLQRAVDALEHLFGSTVGERLASRLKGDALQLFLSPAVSTSNASLRAAPYNLAPYASGTPYASGDGQRVVGPTRARDATRYVSLEDASGLLLAIDAALGDGSGSTLERVGQALGAHTFVTYQRGLDHAEHADVAPWTRRLTTALLASFPADSFVWKAVDRSDGLEVRFYVPGYPRAARVLRHLTVGQMRAAFTFAMEATSADLRILAESLGDRFTISARYRALPPHTDEYATPPSTVRPVPSSGYPAANTPSSWPAEAQTGSGQAGSGYPGSAYPSPGYPNSAYPSPGYPGSAYPSSGHSSLGPPASSRPPHANAPSRSGRPTTVRPSVAEHVNEILKRIPKRY